MRGWNSKIKAVGGGTHGVQISWPQLERGDKRSYHNEIIGWANLDKDIVEEGQDQKRELKYHNK